MKIIAWISVALAMATPAFGDVTKVAGSGSVAQVMDALETAVNGAGATVFARVDHSAGASSIGMELDDAQVLIFGNPKLGTAPIQQDPIAGLFLPLKVLVFSDADGQTWLVYENPADMFDGLNVNPDAPFIGKMTGALAALTAKAAG